MTNVSRDNDIHVKHLLLETQCQVEKSMCISQKVEMFQHTFNTHVIVIGYHKKVFIKYNQHFPVYQMMISIIQMSLPFSRYIE